MLLNNEIKKEPPPGDNPGKKSGMEIRCAQAIPRKGLCTPYSMCAPGAGFLQGLSPHPRASSAYLIFRRADKPRAVRGSLRWITHVARRSSVAPSSVAKVCLPFPFSRGAGGVEKYPLMIMRGYFIVLCIFRADSLLMFWVYLPVCIVLLCRASVCLFHSRYRWLVLFLTCSIFVLA